MKPSPEARRNGAGPVHELPPALSSMWRLCKLGYRHEPALLFSAFVLSHLDRLAMRRDQVLVLDHMYMSLFSTLGWILRLGVTVALLASIHPALVLLALFALPAVLASTWRPAVERRAQERGAPARRLARHL